MRPKLVAGSGCVDAPQLLAGVLGAAGRHHLHPGRRETRRLRELRSPSRCSDAPRPKRGPEGLVGLLPRAFRGYISSDALRVERVRSLTSEVFLKEAGRNLTRLHAE